MSNIKHDEENYKIWYWKTDAKSGIKITGRYVKEYRSRGRAERVAKERYERMGYRWFVSKKNIFRKKCPICGKEYYVDDRPLENNSIQICFHGKNVKHPHFYNYIEICDGCFKTLENMITGRNGDIKL